MTKAYHIVFGEQAKNVLYQSKLKVFTLPQVSWIVLTDNLSEGPLYDLKTFAGLEERMQWIENFYGKISWSAMIRENAKESKKLLSSIQDNDSVYIWLGNEGNEQVWLSSVLNFLKDVKVKVYIIDWSHLKFTNLQGNEITLYSLNVCSPENVMIAHQQFRLMTVAERQYFVEMWNKLRNNNSDLRILHHTILKEVDVSFFDKMLMGNCTTEYQKAAYIVGMTLGDVFEKYEGAGIGDCFLFERLEQLADLGSLEITDKLIRKPAATNLFQVRLQK